MIFYNDEWKPDRKLQAPLYEQIETHIKENIIRGYWAQGSKIPTQRKLAAQFEVNRSTIIAAIQELISEGFLGCKTKGGTVVISNKPLNFSTPLPPDWVSYIRSGVCQPNVNVIQQIYSYESGESIIRLGSGELSPDLIPKGIIDLMFNSTAKHSNHLGYEHPKGSYELRKAISHYLKTIGIDASVNQILIVSGALQALHLISIGILYPGSTILTESPSYIYSTNVFQSAKMKLFGIPLDDEGIQLNKIVKYRRQTNAAMLYTIPSFQNPTGICMSERRKKNLVITCEQERLPIIEDDSYRELYFGPEAPKPLKSYDNNDLILSVGSLSKTFCPGLRIGWVVAHEAVIERLADVKMQTDYGSSSLSQLAATELFTQGVYLDYLIDIRRELKMRRDVALDHLNRYFYDIADWKIPNGGFFIWLNLKNPISMKEVFDNCLAKRVLINPGNAYQHTSNSHIRISYASASCEELETGLKTLSDTIRETYKKANSA